MMWPTHVFAGISFLWLLAILPGGVSADTMGALTAVAAFGALLPDLDAEHSKIRDLSLYEVKPFYLPAAIINRTFGHRSLLHSLFALGMLALIALSLAFWWGWQLSLALALGYASHLTLDAMTKMGIPVFYTPSLYPNRQRYHLLPKRWRFTTGSLAEDVVFSLFVACTLVLLFRHFPFTTA